MNTLDDRIERAQNAHEAQRKDWNDKHLPIRINGRNYWLTIEVPKDLKEVLSHLPEQTEQVPALRIRQVKTTLSEDEYEQLELLVTASELNQSDYIRGMILHGKLEINQTSITDERSLEILSALSADLGKVAGMIRQTVIYNKSFAVLTEEDKRQLELELKDLRRLQKLIQRLAEDLYGHL